MTRGATAGYTTWWACTKCGGAINSKTAEEHNKVCKGKNFAPMKEPMKEEQK